MKIDVKHIHWVIFIVLIACNSQKKAGKNKSSEAKKIEAKYATLLNVPTSQVKNIELYSFIDRWAGTRYKYGGMSKNGVDCSGFCNVLYKEVYKKQLPRTTKEIAKQLNRVNKNKLSEGNLVFFNIQGKKNSHVGVYLMNNKFVHASSSKGVIISSLENPYYKKAYNKGGKI